MFWLVLGLLALCLGVGPAPAEAGPITYIYDELGRLVGAVDATGDSARYTYDGVGNLLSIARQPSSQVSIIEFTPDSGPVGTTVTIYGTGLSATASQNTVTFNGTSATVASATANQLVTTVPVGATTGPIAVTSPSGSATSSTAFTVTSSTGAPTITSFTPTIGTPATPVTITGTNFETTPSTNNVVFNIARATVGSATTTSLATSVPLGTGSGRISVETPRGKAVSTADFFIPPAPYTAADVEVTGRMAIGEDRAVSITTPNKIGLIVFEGTAGQYISLGVTGAIDADVSLLNANGTTLASTSVGGGDIDVKLVRTGTHSIMVDPTGTNTGSVTVTVTQPLVGALSIDGPSLPLTLQRGQDVRMPFSGAASGREEADDARHDDAHEPRPDAASAGGGRGAAQCPVGLSSLEPGSGEPQDRAGRCASPRRPVAAPRRPGPGGRAHDSPHLGSRDPDHDAPLETPVSSDPWGAGWRTAASAGGTPRPRPPLAHRPRCRPGPGRSHRGAPWRCGRRGRA